MNQNYKRNILMMLVFLLFIILSINISQFQLITLNDENKNDIINKFQPKISNGYTPSYIHVDGSDTSNWSNTAINNDWCYEQEGVYYIENCTINASGSPTGSGIVINNSQYIKFVIRNCTVYNAGSDRLDAGIKLENTCNGTLSDNDCSNNNFGGFLLNDECKNNTISENTANNNGAVGIYLFDNCNNNTIGFNTVRENDDVGIVLEDYCEDNRVISNIAMDNGDYGGIHFETYCDNNTIYNNTVGNDITTNQNFGIYLFMHCDENIIFSNNADNNHWYGISFESYCYNNTIIDNTANNNGRYGIYIEDYCDNNTISDCELSGNTIGLLLEVECNNNTIYGNSIINNLEFGVVISNYSSYECMYNLFYNNKFNNPLGTNAVDNCTGNRWDNGIIGNFWHDYNGVDANDDGIGDTPYNGIGGTGNAQDNFPLYDDGPNTFPFEIVIIIVIIGLIAGLVATIGFIYWRKTR